MFLKCRKGAILVFPFCISLSQVKSSKPFWRIFNSPGYLLKALITPHWLINVKKNSAATGSKKLFLVNLFHKCCFSNKLFPCILLWLITRKFYNCNGRSLIKKIIPCWLSIMKISVRVDSAQWKSCRVDSL